MMTSTYIRTLATYLQILDITFIYNMTPAGIIPPPPPPNEWSKDESQRLIRLVFEYEDKSTTSGYHVYIFII
jgi:hypothetical protein